MMDFDQNSLCQAAASVDDVIAITSYGRSGSVFVQSLFDGHPNVICTPGTYLSTFYRFFERHGHLPKADLMQEFLNSYTRLFDSATAGWEDFKWMGPERNQALSLNRDVFCQAMTLILDDYEGTVPRKYFF